MSLNNAPVYPKTQIGIALNMSFDLNDVKTVNFKCSELEAWRVLLPAVSVGDNCDDETIATDIEKLPPLLKQVLAAHAEQRPLPAALVEETQGIMRAVEAAVVRSRSGRRAIT